MCRLSNRLLTLGSAEAFTSGNKLKDQVAESHHVKSIQIRFHAVGLPRWIMERLQEMGSIEINMYILRQQKRAKFVGEKQKHV